MGIFDRKEHTEGNPEVTGGNTEPAKQPEKSQAELLAEGLATAFAPVNETLKNIGERLERVEGRVTPRTPENAENGNQNQPVRTSVFDDEDRAIAERVAPIFQMQLETNARLVFNDVKQEFLDKGYSEIWNKYATKIAERVQAEPLLNSLGQVNRGNPARVRDIVTMVFGEAALSSGVKFGGKDRGFFIESAGGGSESGDGRQPDDGLTEEQRKFFIKNKIPLEAGKASVGKLKFWR